MENGGRELGTSRKELADPGADVSLSGKKLDAETPREPAIANGGPTNGSDLSTKIQEQDCSHAEGPANEAVSEVRAAENVSRNNVMSHEATFDEPNKETMDENGEEVVEAAEDTVIY
jgi:hypothetical protein